MLRRLVLFGFVGVVGLVIREITPDVRRYLKLRGM